MFTGFINRRNQVERVQTTIANAMLGEMALEVVVQRLRTG